MALANSNRMTALSIVERALDIADIQNTDFLSYREKVQYLNDTFRNVYQKMIEAGMNVFVNKANLVGSAGRYPLPFDFYQMKAVKNPVTGRLIPRVADSESVLSGYYDIEDNELILGPSSGPVIIEYYRKPFFLSFPNSPRETSLNIDISSVIDTNGNSLLVLDNGVLKVAYPFEDSEVEVGVEYNPDNKYYLGNNVICEVTENEARFYTFSGSLVFTDTAVPDEVVKSDNNAIYFRKGTKVYIPGTEVTIGEAEESNTVVIDGAPYNMEGTPIGLFDGRPTVYKDRKLYIGDHIIEALDIPAAGNLAAMRDGLLDATGTIWSNVPDTLLDFPNSLYYNVIAYDLAMRFLAKQNADSSGVDSLNREAWRQLYSEMDNAADFKRIKLVRR